MFRGNHFLGKIRGSRDWKIGQVDCRWIDCRGRVGDGYVFGAGRSGGIEVVGVQARAGRAWVLACSVEEAVQFGVGAD